MDVNLPTANCLLTGYDVARGDHPFDVEFEGGPWHEHGVILRLTPFRSI